MTRAGCGAADGYNTELKKYGKITARFLQEFCFARKQTAHANDQNRTADGESSF